MICVFSGRQIGRTKMILFLLFATGLFAGTIDAIAGGGGLVSIPVLLSIGMPPHIAFGTNKFQGTVGTFMATLKYYRHGLIAREGILIGLLFTLLGGIAGAVTTQLLSSEFLRYIIPILLFGILVYTICSPRLGDLDKKPKISITFFYASLGFLLAFYDGFFGPGVGSFWVFALTFFLGYNLIKATAYTKVFNLNSSFIAAICFALGGNIDYRFAICMAIGQLIGGRLGAHLAIYNGVKVIRPIFLCVVSMTIASLVYKTYSTSTLFAEVTERVGVIPQLIAMSLLVLSLFGIYIVINRRERALPSS